MAQVQKGDTVRIHYNSTLEDGTPAGSTEGAEPLEIQTGKGMVFPKLEQEMLGMHTGERKSTTLQPEEAFGDYRQELVTKIGLEEFTSRGIEPYEGLTLDIPTQDGQTFQAKVTEISDQNVQLDANHPLAGHAITFSVQVVDIK
jgi:FKBP-type peptidyl-prolyl cis-trans isomerase 2